jgi:hypothetical protein
MATYKEILGTAVQNFAGDPANPIIGQVWYNSISGRFRYNEVAPQLGAWQTGGSLNTARNQLGSAGTQTSALAFGGITTVNTGATESYNGTSWTSSPNSLNTVRRALGGTGATNTAALAFGGRDPGGIAEGETESWNGTSWTELNDLNTARWAMGSAGTNTAALAFGGGTPATTGATEAYNDPYYDNLTITTTV